MTVDLDTLCDCADYKHERKKVLLMFAYLYGLLQPLSPWRFCPYCGKPIKYDTEQVSVSTD
jgi:predicted nucleic acid-binding Zn ribbon protein